MQKPITACVAALSAAILVTSPTPANAALFTHQFEFSINAEYGDFSYASVGDKVLVTVATDPNARSGYSVPGIISSYKPASVSISVNGVTTDLSYQTYLRISNGELVSNSQTSALIDQYHVEAWTLGGDGQLGIFFDLVDPTGTAFSDTGLPLSTPSLSMFSLGASRPSLLGEHDFRFWTANFTVFTSEVRGTAQSISPVPLPAAAWLLLSGFGGLGAFARRRKASERLANASSTA